MSSATSTRGRTRALALFAASITLLGLVVAESSTPASAGTHHVVKKKRWPAAPRPSVAASRGVVRVSWPTAAYATRYRVFWSTAPFGKRIARTTPWLSQATRSSTLSVKSSGFNDATWTSPAFGGPLWVRVQSSNVAHARISPWLRIWPTAPTPSGGTRVRVGTYNIFESSTEAASTTAARDTAVAHNIGARGLAVVALQEVKFERARALAARINAAQPGASWKVADDGSNHVRDLEDQQIVYDAQKLTLLGTGTFTNVTNNYSGTNLEVPWARLQPVGGGSPFYVASAHFTFPPGASQTAGNRAAGDDARTVADDLARINTANEPVVLAGDFTSNGEPWTDAGGPQRQLVLTRGYYDAQGAASRVNTQYSTFNGRKAQSASTTGIYAHPDYLMLKGLGASTSYVNVARWSDNGLIPSDHNLVYADVLVP
jgi:hypothetical protein